jgi:hypothetical protein
MSHTGICSNSRCKPVDSLSSPGFSVSPTRPFLERENKP